MGFDQPVHWVVILIVAGLLFGGYKKLPEMARSAGRSMRIFKTEIKGMADDDEVRTAAKSDTAATPVTATAVEAPAVVNPVVGTPVAGPAAAPAQSVAPAPASVAPSTAPSGVTPPSA